MRCRFAAPAVTILLIGTVSCFAAQRRGAGPKQNPRPTGELRALFESNFPQWDRNQDRLLDMKELNALIESPQVRGTEAAAVFILRKRIIAAHKDDDESQSENEDRNLSRVQVMALGDDPATQREVKRTTAHIQKISRELFLPTDPNLATFHQGRVGDCYFMSVLGAFVYRDPRAVRAMVTPLPGGACEVRFATGKRVQVPAPTDAELVMCAREGSTHGMWIAVFEKAYGEIRKEKREQKSGNEIEDDDAVTHDLIGGGGLSGPVIEQFTGHRTAAAPMSRWLKGGGVDMTAEQVHEVLARRASERRLMAVYTSHNREQKIPVPHGHAFGVLGYDPERRMVRVFNPWGNNHTPSGPPGMTNGYVVRNGIFELPLREFVRIFIRLVYETDQPADGK